MVYLADLDHGTGRNHVENELLDRSRLEPRRAGQHLGTGHGLNGKICALPDLRPLVTGNCNGLAPSCLGVHKAAHHIGSTTACRQANDKILVRESTPPQVARAKLLAVFGTFDSLDKRRLASGNEPDNQIG